MNLVVAQTVGVGDNVFVNPAMVSVVAVQSIHGGYPHKAPYVLQHIVDHGVRQPVFRTQFSEDKVLLKPVLFEFILPEGQPLSRKNPHRQETQQQHTTPQAAEAIPFEVLQDYHEVLR
jgi:hypothetical protein